MHNSPATAEALDAIRQELRALSARLDAPPQRWLGIDSAATYADLSPASIRRLLSAGKLQPYRPVRGKVLIDRLALDALISGSTKRARTGRGIRH